ncbi:MAG: hypothetical protein PWQ77_2040, partial [Kosmotogales bacterium]|nr:hypothetical protein [Kosmotogales bacterium]
PRKWKNGIISVGYRSVNNDAAIQTISYNSNYEMANIDHLVIETNYAMYVRQLVLDNTHAIFTYRQSGSAYLQVISCNSNGDSLTKLGNKLRFDYYENTAEFYIINETSSYIYFIMVFTGSSDYDGYLQTFKVDRNTWAISSIDKIEYDTDSGWDCSMAQIDSTHYIVSNNGGSGKGYIRTFSVDADGSNITKIDELQHESTNCQHTALCKIDDAHFVLAYKGANDDGYIKMFSIDSSYEITQIDSLEHDTVEAQNNSIIALDSKHVALVYKQSSTGYLKIFSINSNYGINQLSSTSFGTSNSSQIISKLDNDHFVIGYTGSSDDAYLKIYYVEMPDNEERNNVLFYAMNF